MRPALLNLEPKQLWKHFDTLASIPRASTKEACRRGQFSDWKSVDLKLPSAFSRCAVSVPYHQVPRALKCAFSIPR